MAPGPNSSFVYSEGNNIVGQEQVSPATEIEFRKRVRTSGMLFSAYLPPALAEWLLDQIDDGTFTDPQEALFTIVGRYRNLEPHPASRGQLLREACAATLFDDPLYERKSEDLEHCVKSLLSPPNAPATWGREAAPEINPQETSNPDHSGVVVGLCPAADTAVRHQIANARPAEPLSKDAFLSARATPRDGIGDGALLRRGNF